MLSYAIMLFITLLALIALLHTQGGFKNEKQNYK